MSWREDARQLADAAHAHTPDGPRLLCRGCMAHGEVNTWPCDEAVWATKALLALDTPTNPT